MASLHVPPIFSEAILDFVCPGSSIGKEYPDIKWPTHVPSFLQYFSDENYSKGTVIVSLKNVADKGKMHSALRMWLYRLNHLNFEKNTDNVDYRRTDSCLT